MAKKKNFYTLKEGKALELKGIKEAMLITLALLSDKYKFKPEEIEKFMKEVTFAANNMGDLLSRKELLEIINKHTGLDMHR